MNDKERVNKNKGLLKQRPLIIASDGTPFEATDQGLSFARSYCNGFNPPLTWKRFNKLVPKIKKTKSKGSGK